MSTMNPVMKKKIVWMEMTSCFLKDRLGENYFCSVFCISDFGINNAIMLMKSIDDKNC